MQPFVHFKEAHVDNGVLEWFAGPSGFAGTPKCPPGVSPVISPHEEDDFKWRRLLEANGRDVENIPDFQGQT